MSTSLGSAIGSALCRRTLVRLGALALVVMPAACSRADAERAGGASTTLVASVTAMTPEEAGRYLVRVAGCNDCHTDGYLETNGQVPESEWLTGSVMGWRGPWGTTYPSNLRLSVQNMTEDQWVEMLSTRQGVPPMPWAGVNAMSDGDQRALYRYLKQLGPKGEVRQAPLPPDVEPQGPWFDLEPNNLPVAPASGS